jgi:hypothetical protein
MGSGWGGQHLAGGVERERLLARLARGVALAARGHQSAEARVRVRAFRRRLQRRPALPLRLQDHAPARSRARASGPPARTWRRGRARGRAGGQASTG